MWPFTLFSLLNGKTKFAVKFLTEFYLLLLYLNFVKEVFNKTCLNNSHVFQLHFIWTSLTINQLIIWWPYVFPYYKTNLSKRNKRLSFLWLRKKMKILALCDQMSLRYVRWATARAVGATTLTKNVNTCLPLSTSSNSTDLSSVSSDQHPRGNWTQSEANQCRQVLRRWTSLSKTFRTRTCRRCEEQWRWWWDSTQAKTSLQCYVRSYVRWMHLLAHAHYSFNHPRTPSDASFRPPPPLFLHLPPKNQNVYLIKKSTNWTSLLSFS